MRSVSHAQPEAIKEDRRRRVEEAGCFAVNGSSVAKVELRSRFRRTGHATRAAGAIDFWWARNSGSSADIVHCP